MKKILLVIMAAMLLICAPSCRKKSVLDWDDDTALLTYDGTVLMDVGYFRQLMTEQNVSGDILGTDILPEKKLFIYNSEVLILSHIAEMNLIAADRAEISIEYDDHIEEIADQTSYPGQLEYFNKLRDALALSPQGLKEFVVNETYHTYNVSNVIEDISASYQFVTDKDILLEYLQINILEFIESADVELAYPGTDTDDLDFMDVLEEH